MLQIFEKIADQMNKKENVLIQVVCGPDEENLSQQSND
jgi:hypothetical protein